MRIPKQNHNEVNHVVQSKVCMLFTQADTKPVQPQGWENSCHSPLMPRFIQRMPLSARCSVTPNLSNCIFRKDTRSTFPSLHPSTLSLLGASSEEPRAITLEKSETPQSAEASLNFCEATHGDCHFSGHESGPSGWTELSNLPNRFELHYH